jgi:hypothetical protein
MVRDSWYRHLAIADRLIVEARDSIDRHKQHLRVLAQDGEDTGTATALLSLLEETLHLMHRHRATILTKVAAYRSLDVGQDGDGREDDDFEWPTHPSPT